MTRTSPTLAEPVERIDYEGTPIAIVVRGRYSPPKTEFLTPSDYQQQLGFIVYPAGGVIRAHTHKPVERRLAGTSEVVLVRSGRLEVDLYSDARELIGTRLLETGDLLLLINGGHGFRMLQDTVLLEIKQGPYTGMDDKERFQP